MEEESTVTAEALTDSKASVVEQTMAYAGLVYYEQDGVEDLVTFTAAKNLNALLQVILNSLVIELCVLCLVY